MPVAIDAFREWEGTAEDLAETLEGVVAQLGLAVEPPTVRTIRLWRTKGLVTRSASGRFGIRQVLESLATALLLRRGWTSMVIADLLPTLDGAALEAHLTTEAEGGAVAWTAEIGQSFRARRPDRDFAEEAAEDAAVLLAQGIVRVYERVLTGREIIRQDDSLPRELHVAMCLLGRLYIEEGQVDRAASVHDVLARAATPLSAAAWGLDAFSRPSFRFGDAVLLDPELRVPTADCAVIANVSGGFGEDHVIEHRLHGLLRDGVDRLGSRRRHAGYTAVRELVGRHSLVSERVLAQFIRERELLPLQELILTQFFTPVPDAWLIRGRAHQCAYCRTLMRPHRDERRYPDGYCPIRQCRGKGEPQLGEALDPAEDRLLVARPQVLTYWAGPAIDELAIYDEARGQGLDAELYPQSDLCDVSIDRYGVGIDAKSYTSPVSLALRLNRGIGGLVNYRRRMIAVGDELIAARPDYIVTARSMLDRKGDPATLELQPVSAIRAHLRRGRHA
jgi:REase associating with pPIWI_RE